MNAAEQARKRARTDSKSATVRALTERDKVLEAIRSKTNSGAGLKDLRRELEIPQNIIQKQVKFLLNTNEIKIVPDRNHKGRKVYMGEEFEPSEELTGGKWFSGGSLDTEAVNNVKDKCKQQLIILKVATAEMIHNKMKKSDPGLIYSMQQIGDVLEALVLDKEVEEVKSTGKGDFANVPAGKTCYRMVQMNSGAYISGLASIPCAVCPRIRECTPDGIISPRNCEYFKKWLGGDIF